MLGWTRDGDVDAPILHLRGEDVEVVMDPPQPAHADGDGLGEMARCRLRVEAEAVPVVVPRAD